MIIYASFLLPLYQRPVSSLPSRFTSAMMSVILIGGGLAIYGEEEKYVDVDGDDEELRDEYEYERHQPLYDCSEEASHFLQRLEKDQLDSFSWTLGACVSSEILGPDGIIPLQQSQIRSLSLTMSPDYPHTEGEVCEIDLSQLRKIRNLSWTNPDSDHLHTLSIALQASRAHLKKLELDFVDCLGHPFDLESDSDDDEDDNNPDPTEPNCLFGDLLGLKKTSLCPLLPDIRVLSLSKVTIIPAMAEAVNFATLHSLTLRKCPGWEGFLKRVVESMPSIHLKRFEIQQLDRLKLATQVQATKSFINFLSAFEGLQELFVGEVGPISTLDLWSGASHYHATLMRFVHHQAPAVTYKQALRCFARRSALWESNHGITEWERLKMKEGSLPCTGENLQMDFLGLFSVTDIPKNLLLSFITTPSSLKVLHTQESDYMLPSYSSLDSRANRFDESPEASIKTPSRNNVHLGGLGYGLPPKYANFAEWAFGPQGIASLQIIAFVPIAHVRHLHVDNLLLCRSKSGGNHFRYFRGGGPEWTAFRDEYRTAIEACSVGVIHNTYY